MANLVAKLSLQEIITGPNPKTGEVKTGLVSAPISLRHPFSQIPNSLIKVVEITDSRAKFHIENLHIKSNPAPQPVFDFELAVNQSETVFVPLPEGTHELVIKLLGIVPKPQTPAKPQIKMPMHYFEKIQSLLTRLETDLSTKILVYYTHPNTQITQLDPDYFSEFFHNSPKYPKISLVLHSSGGDSMASLRIASFLRHYCEQLEIIIPAKATSAATLLSLSADKILFTPLGYLGPIDTQLVNIKDERLTNWSHPQISSDSFRRAKDMLNEPDKNLNGYTELSKYVHPIIIAEIDRLSSRSKRTAYAMLKMHHKPFEENKIEYLSNHLVYDYPSHGYPILYPEACEMGLNAEMLPDHISNLLWEVMKYYRAITQEKITDINTEWYHVEHNQVVIESLGKRIVRRYSFDRKLSQFERKWQIQNDNSNWKKYLPPEKPGEQPRILSVEVEDSPPVKKEI